MRKLIKTLLIIAVSILAASCMKDKSWPDCPNNEGGVKVTFRFGSNPLSSVTRALTFAQENEIEDINVLVFDSTDELVDILEGKNVVVTTGSLNPLYSAEGTFSVILKPSASATDTYNLVVLANAETAIMSAYGSLDVDDVTYKDYDDVIAALFVSVNSKLYPSGGIIPMWGESGQIEIKTGTAVDPLELTRAIARVDVGVGQAAYIATDNAWEWDGKDGTGATIPFCLGSVYLMRPNDKFAIIPDVDELSAGNPTILAGTSAISMANSIINFKYDDDDIAGVTSDRGGYLTQHIYTPEMAMPGAPGDANHSNRMALVVGGYYNGSTTETFYRLDFVKSNNLMNVLRNHLYRFDITSVYGAGYPTVEIAYNSNTFNMTFDVLDWDAGDMGDIIFDGTYYVSLKNSRNENRDDRTAVVYRKVGTNDIIEFGTNISLDKFVLELNNGGDFPTPGDKTVIENDRFKVELKSAGGVNWFEFTALEEYAAATDNPSILTVTADNRIKFNIIIMQKDDDPEGWEDGGNINKGF